MDRVRLITRTIGELLVTAGVIVLLFIAYELWGTGFYTSHQQNAMRHTLTQVWTQQRPRPSTAPSVFDVVPISAQRPVPEGQGFAILRIPRFGSDYAKVIVEGVGYEDLKKGPGHYPGTALPGEVGNVVIAGHRTTYGAPFNRLAELKAGDAITIETDHWNFTYTVTGESVVDPSAIFVTYPVPGHPGAVPTQRLLTLTTCNPEYSARQRLIVHAILSDSQPKPTTTAASG